MRSSSLLSILSAASVLAQDGWMDATGELGDATVASDNPIGLVYTAIFPETAFATDAYPQGGNVKGRISAGAGPNGFGVTFKVDISNLPRGGGPFPYHIHAVPVPADGNCMATGGHLDPFKRGASPACDDEFRQTCEVGDLSGKHGSINSDPFSATYNDLYVSIRPDSMAFLGNLSIVLHAANMTRITCANFTLEKNSTASVDATSNDYDDDESFMPPYYPYHASGAAGQLPQMGIYGSLLAVAMILLL